MLAIHMFSVSSCVWVRTCVGILRGRQDLPEDDITNTETYRR